MNPIYKWMGIVLAVGIVLMVVEYRFAKKKKEGVTPTDKKRVLGILWIAIFLSLLVGDRETLAPWLARVDTFNTRGKVHGQE